MERSERDSARLGIAVQVAARMTPEGSLTAYRPDGPDRLHGFSVQVLQGWLHVSAWFEPEPYASALLVQMSSAGSDARAVFWSLVDSLADESTHVDFNLGGQVVDRESPQSWGSDWTGLRLRLESPAGVAAPPGDEALPAAWAAKLFALVLALLSVAEIGSADEEFLGREEGMRQETTAASRTRSAANRLACLQLKGSRCLACGADLGHVYGAIGDGCIEVHHLERLADYSEPRRVNPATDLVPLCPNCHAIAHRASPPLGVDDLKRSLAEGSLLHAATPDGESEA